MQIDVLCDWLCALEERVLVGLPVLVIVKEVNPVVVGVTKTVEEAGVDAEVDGKAVRKSGE